MTSSWVENTKLLGSVEFDLWSDVARRCSGSRPVSGTSFLSMEVRNAEIFSSSFQSLLSSLARSVMRALVFSGFIAS